MYLKRLEIQGFKSFAGKATLDFLPECPAGRGKQCGITAIVGPNGSGKSNIADAIRFAIGEQSSKNLRGKKAEDVIFSGTAAKARLGSAAVSLHFDNSDKRLPLDFGEVSLTRKVYRSGESEYLINGSRVRLLDVVDVLAKAGIGRDSYCVITQGMSDTLLTATPLERRTIFEDAAGVKPYQLEKERAVRKLVGTRENLERVRALIEEIEPHLKMLKRQADRAQQGQTVVEKLRAKQRVLYGFLWDSLQKERSRLSAKRSELEQTVARLAEDVERLRVQTEASSRAMQTGEREEALDTALVTSREALSVVMREESVLEGRKQVELEKREEREEVRVIPVDLPYVLSALGEIRTSQHTLIERLQQVERLEDLQEIREFAQGIKQRLTDLSEQAEAGSVTRKTMLGLTPEEQRASDARLQKIEKMLAELRVRRRSIEETLAAQGAELKVVREEGRRERVLFFEREKAAREAEQLWQTGKDSLNELRVQMARVEVHEEDLTALVREELALSPVELMYEQGVILDREKAEREIARLKVEAEHIGTIDPLIVQEYEETAKRYTFLSREATDLDEAIEKLSAVIQEMDKKIDTVFEKTFTEIRKNFQHYFTTIFAGGKAEIEPVRVKMRSGGERNDGLEPVDEDDPTPTGSPGVAVVGIDIVACPPGKKITSLAMLSGGERALTSLALLFAIISHNPPPFAILDEVEAALDEANSRRFGKLLAELAGRTQFIVITHNRETMTQAGLLYGVTMGGDGISQLLSVRLEQIGEGGKIVKE